MMQQTESITSNDELDDGLDQTPFSLVSIDTTLLTSPAVLRALGGIVVGLAILTWPDRSDRLLTRLIGFALIWMALTALRTAARQTPVAWLSMITALGTMALGVALVLSPDQSTTTLGRLVGLALVGYAVHSSYKVLRSPDGDNGRLTLYSCIGAIGALLIVAADDVFATAVAVGAMFSIALSLLMLIISLDARTPGTATYEDTAALVGGWLRDRPKSVDARHALYDKILYEGPTTQTRIIRFFTLMGFAAVIASMGVITDSTAVVIGAMLVAPLMTPLMGMAISLVMGWPNRLTRSAIIAFGGIVFAIGIGVLLGLIAPASIDTATNSQILGRTSPTILDMVTAVAAGAAGAYGLSRPDVSDSLPGVAIAISLVPPLTVVGIAYSQADWIAGNGALLLFATNMVAILLVGGLTFIVTGVTPLSRMTENQHRVKTALGVTCTAAVLVFGALLINGAQITNDALRQSTVDSSVNDWLADALEHRFVNATLDDDVVEALVVGPSTGLPDVAILAELLTDELDKSVTVNVSLVVEERLTATGNG